MQQSKALIYAKAYKSNAKALLCVWLYLAFMLHVMFFANLNIKQMLLYDEVIRLISYKSCNVI